ncbi:TRAP transporter small permease subunit [Marinobacterium zhoushanense]|uniref:TRAP transporter small permease subunit n=1 Tax=Marinobacterium zhoushanense TaxID=1679163 RepID=UPI00166EC4FB|nr:TRAP transporter small permease [Marinobacterium zhoushanense]
MLNNIAKLLDITINRANQVTRWIARLGGIILLASVFMIVAEILFRKVASLSIIPATEISGYFMAIIASWSFAYAMLEKAHIRIDIFYLKSCNKVRNFLDILAIFSLVFISIFATDAVFSVTLDTYESDAHSNSPLMAPLWIPQFLWMFGFMWFSFSVSLLLLRALVALLQQDQKKFSHMLSSPSVEDHVNEVARN